MQALQEPKCRLNPVRVRRACDRCNSSRTRCSGELPCRRCSKLNHSCQYRRELKKRGPKPRSSRKAPESTTRRDVVQHEQPTSGPRECSSSDDDTNESPSLRMPYTPGSTKTESDCGGEWKDNGDNPYSPPWTTDSSQSDSRARLNGNGNPFPSWDSDSDCSRCRYPCLNPILPLLRGILSPEDACDLLDIFFVESESSLNFLHCPYVLSPVIRKKSLLSPTNPRPVSPALLAIMLWCVAHTANIEVFKYASARASTIQHLYALSMELLRTRDCDNWHRISGGWTLETELPIQTPGARRASRSNSMILERKPEQNVDDILSFVLLTCVISGSEFKEDSLKWWNKAVLLVKKLGYHSEARISQQTPSSAQMSLATREAEEERRRAFWLVYALDRHLALCFNEPLHIHDAECQVLTPLPEWAWESLESIPVEEIPPRVYGPATRICGTGFFDYFLPLMAILGDIIEFRFRGQHPRLGGLDDARLVGVIEGSLVECEYSLELLRTAAGTILDPVPSSLASYPPLGDSPESSAVDGLADSAVPSLVCPVGQRVELVIAYSRYIIRVLHVLLYGKWDAISLLEDSESWIASPEFLVCTSNSIAAGESIAQILDVDRGLSFMPFLLGIYLFHGSLTFLLLADRMPQVGVNISVKEACEVIIRAHEVSVMTFNTAFQRNFCRALRSTLDSAHELVSVDCESRLLTREVLSMYRWTRGRRGLCL